MEKNSELKKEQDVRDFLPLSQAAKIVGCTPEHLNLLCRKGIMRGEKIGRNWHTTKEWIREYFLEHEEKVCRANGEAQKILEAVPVRKEEKSDAKVSELKEKILQAEKAADTLAIEKERIAAEKFYVEERNFKIRKKLALRFFTTLVTVATVFVFVMRTQIISRDQLFYSDVDGEWTEIKSGAVKGEALTQSVKIFSNTTFKSEHFAVKEIAFGGDVVVAAGEKEKSNPEIFDVHGEAFLAKNKKDSEIVVTWKTNKMTRNEIEYAKNGSSDVRRLAEPGFGFSHGVVISKLDPATAYTYRVIALDRWGNRTESDYYAIYSGSETASIFELIAQEFEKLFDWAIEK